MVTGTGTLGTNKVSKEGISLYPNPAVNSVYLKMEDESLISTVSIFDLKGRLVSEITYTPYQAIDISKLKAGSYLIKVTSESGYYSIGFSKIK